MLNNKLSVIIPSRTEVYLNHTIRDVLKNATGEIEVLPVLDGYEPDELVEDDRVRYIRMPASNVMQKRHCINKAVKESKGDYVMSLDAHCMVAPGFNTQLIKDHQPNWVQIPRRNRLDAMNWCLQEQYGKPPIDYEYFMFRPLARGESLHGFKWDDRTRERMHIPIDDTLEFQGSCWFMTKEWFNKMGFMQIEGYRGWGQEAEEIGLKTRLNGGEVKTNKNTWYAHLHKGSTYGRMYHMNQSEQKMSYEYSRKIWLVDNKDFFISVIENFMPIPGWPENWKELIWKVEKN
jgi:hypothetical protein